MRKLFRVDEDEYIPSIPKIAKHQIRELELAWTAQLAHRGELLFRYLDTHSILERKGQDPTWNSHFELGCRICEMNPSSCIVLNLVRRDKGEVLGGTTLYLFEKQGEEHILRQGHYKLRIYPREAEFPTDPGKCKTYAIPDYSTVASEFKKLGIVEQFLKEYDDGFVEPEAFQSRIDPREVEQLQRKEAEVSNRLYVFVRLPQLPFPAHFGEKEIDRSFVDAEAELGINPVEKFWKKFGKLFGEDPKEHQPSGQAYDYLMELFTLPITWKWTPENRAIIWKYRYWLRAHEYALPKFVQIIDWEDRGEVDEVRDILLSWRRPSHWTCLELMAVEDPMLPEDIDLMWAGGFSRSIYEIDVEILTLILPCVLEYFRRISQFQEFFPMAEPDETDVTDQTTKKRAVNLLGDYLVERALEHPSFAQFLFWQLKMRSKEISTGRETRDNIFARLLGLLLHRMQQNQDTAQLMQSFFKQEQLFKKMSTVLKDPRLNKLNRAQRVAFLKEHTNDPKNGILSFTTLPLPYDSNVKVTGTLPDKIVVFKSAAMPVKVSFVTTDIEEHSIIVKAGEDLRQDVFVLGVLRLMDEIWRRDGLDLRVTPYRCVALTLSTGILEFIPSEPLSNVIAAYGGSVLAYLNAAATNPSLGSLNSSFELVDRSNSSTMIPQNEIVPEAVLENYVRSCAAYCVFTYIMGIGDRHLDNLLLTKDGRIFHVDFAYLFGNDPKPFPPPMKLCKEMVEAMGGPSGALFKRFKSFCFTAFTFLRRHARLLIAYMTLCTTNTGSLYVQDKLMLHLDEVGALIALEKLIDESMNALFPKVFETLHKWAQYWRQ